MANTLASKGHAKISQNPVHKRSLSWSKLPISSSALLQTYKYSGDCAYLWIDSFPHFGLLTLGQQQHFTATILFLILFYFLTLFLLPCPNLPPTMQLQPQTVQNSFQRSHAFVFCGKVWRIPRKKNYNSFSPLWSVQCVELKYCSFFFISLFILPCQKPAVYITHNATQPPGTLVCHVS